MKKKNNIFYCGDNAGTAGKFAFDDDKRMDYSCAACSTAPFASDNIASFRVTKQINIRKVKPVNINLVVRSRAFKSSAKLANVVGIQNGIEVYNKIISSSEADESGKIKFDFPQFLPIVTGDISWLAIIYNNNFKGDTAMAATKVAD